MGRQYFSNYAAGPTTHANNTTFADVLSLTFTPDSSTSYLILGQTALNSTAPSGGRLEAKFLNSTDTVTLASTSVAGDLSTDEINFPILAKYTSSASPGSHIFKVQYANTVANNGAVVTDTSLIALRMEVNDLYTENNSTQTTTSSSYASKLTLSGSNYSVTGNITIVAYGEMNASDVASPAGIKLLDNSSGISYAEKLDFFGAATGFEPWAATVNLSVTAGDPINLSIQVKRISGTGTITVQNLRIAVIQWGATVENTYIANAKALATTTSTTYASDNSITQTLFNKHYLIIDSSIGSNTSASESVKQRLEIDGTTIVNENIWRNSFDPTATTQHFSAHVFLPTAGSHTVATQYCSKGGVSVGIQDASLVLVQLDDTATNVAPPAASLSLTAFVPTISLGAAISVPAASLTLAEPLPTPQMVISAPVNALSLTAQVPSLSIGVAISVPASSLSLGKFTPTQQIIISPPAGVLSLTPFAPDVLIISPGISIPAAALSLTAFAPSVSAGTSISVPAATLSATSFIPSQNLNLLPPVNSLNLAPLAPSVVESALVLVPTGSLSITGVTPTQVLSLQSPTAVLSLSALVPAVSIGAAVFAPTASTALLAYTPQQNLLISPPTVSLTFTTYAPFLPAIVPVPTSVFSLTAFAPSIHIIPGPDYISRPRASTILELTNSAEKTVINTSVYQVLNQPVYELNNITNREVEDKTIS